MSSTTWMDAVLDAIPEVRVTLPRGQQLRQRGVVGLGVHPHGARRWLAGRIHESEPRPDELPIVRDNLMHVWQPGDDGQMHMTTGWHHASWNELRSRFDLVEVC